MERRICYLHIGTHKTGTTSIQAFLAANQDRLAQLGVLIPAAGRPSREFAGHHNVAWELRRDGRHDAALGGLNDVVRELRRSDAHTACLSSEDFELLYNVPEAIPRLREAIEDAGFTARVVVALRPQAGYCERVYAEIRKHGFPLRFDDFVDDVVRMGTFVWPAPPPVRADQYGPPFDYAALLDRFAQAFGARALVVRRYRSGRDDAEMLRAILRLLVGRRAEAANSWVFPSRLNATTSPVSLSAVQLRRIAGRFAAASERLARRYGVVVPAIDEEYEHAAAERTA
jgi:hypothetical protein